MYRSRTARTLLLLLVAGSVMLAASGARAEESGDYRLGAHYSGHLLFRDVVAAEGQWILRDREQFWLSDLNLEAGLGVSVTAPYFTVPVLFRAEIMHYRVIGLELSAGAALSFYKGTFGATPTACAGLPIGVKRVRVQPEACANLSAGRALWGVGVLYAF